MTGVSFLERMDADLIEPPRLAACVIDELVIARRKPIAPVGITAREALIALRFETWFVAIAAENLAQGLALSDEDRARLLIAHGRIATIAEEVIR